MICQWQKCTLRRADLPLSAYYRCIANNPVTFPILSRMIHSKKTIVDIMKTCDGADTLSREEKFEVFCKVCDNMLNEGRITKVNHTRWTTIF